MIGMALGSRARAALDLPPQELLLSRPAEGVPDQPVRRTAVLRRAARRGAHPPRAPRGGRGEARSTSARAGASTARTRSVVDFNRGGTPLAEIVTEPDVRSAEQAREWLRLLRTTLRQLGVSDVNMEEGSLRCDANISIRPVGATELGTKTELKNMNSFRFIERGIRAEIARQERAAARRRAASSRRRCTSTRGPRRSRRCAPRRRRTTTATSPSPTCRRCTITEAMLERARAAMPELPAARERALRRRARR